MNIITIKNKEDLRGLTKEDLTEDNILIKISLPLYKELLADEDFYEKELIDEETVRCPVCGCSKFIGVREYIVGVGVDDKGYVDFVDDIKDATGNVSRDIACDFCGTDYELNS